MVTIKNHSTTLTRESNKKNKNKQRLKTNAGFAQKLKSKL